MSTYVYNDGSFDPKQEGTLYVTVGLFFDGTKNNRYHTEIRKKIEKKGEFKDQSPTEDEQAIYADYGDNESFGNDFTNVARKFMCCDENYAIYVEGIGTADKKWKDQSDRMDGFAYGRGVTGIIAKVRSGCKMLAEKIKKEYDNETEKNDVTQIDLTVDAFGFSRGAAAARHFLYNLQKESYAPSYETVNVVHTIPSDLAVIKKDYAGYDVKEGWLKEGQLPKVGFLGTALLESGIARELIETMKVTVRFLGIYDTVASYDPDCLLLPSFEKQIHKLHLHDLGVPVRAVHYTALEEHRKNFSLTRLSIGQEFNFPGVHSDVGGSYNHDPLSKAELDQAVRDAKLYTKMTKTFTPKTCEYEKVRLDDGTFFKNFRNFRQELIQEGWFFEEEIDIRYVFPIEKHLYAERILNGGYSFIPLHFMSDEAIVYLNDETLFQRKLFSDYALNDDFLEKVKTYLKLHTIEGGNNWELKNSSTSYSDTKRVPSPENQGAIENNSFVTSEEIIPTFDLEEVEVSAYQPDYMLRKLRNEYLHWSAKINNILDRIAYAPAENRKRGEF